MIDLRKTYPAGYNPDRAVQAWKETAKRHLEQADKKSHFFEFFDIAKHIRDRKERLEKEKEILSKIEALEKDIAALEEALTVASEAIEVVFFSRTHNVGAHLAGSKPAFSRNGDEGFPCGDLVTKLAKEFHSHISNMIAKKRAEIEKLLTT
jgi:hypothetical protein